MFLWSKQIEAFCAVNDVDVELYCFHCSIWTNNSSKIIFVRSNLRESPNTTKLSVSTNVRINFRRACFILRFSFLNYHSFWHIFYKTMEWVKRNETMRCSFSSMMLLFHLHLPFLAAMSYIPKPFAQSKANFPCQRPRILPSVYICRVILLHLHSLHCDIIKFGYWNDYNSTVFKFWVRLICLQQYTHII